MSDKKQRGGGRGQRGRERERTRGKDGALTCTCLPSLRIHLTIHLLRLCCADGGQSDQTPIRFFTAAPTVTPSPFFFPYDTQAGGKENNSTSKPNGDVREGTGIKTGLSWRLRIINLHLCVRQSICAYKNSHSRICRMLLCV